MLEDTAQARLRCSSISLEDGADEAWLNGEPIVFCEGGMCFPSRWQFETGTALAMTLEICGTGEKAKAEGVVVGCERVEERLWSVTVLLLNTSADWAKIEEAKVDVRGDFGELGIGR
jgi:hypothetical protein